MDRDIHLIEKIGNINPLDEKRLLWESGWWVVSLEKAEYLIGGRIFFHKAQDKPSFFGGRITRFRVETDGEWKGRILFTFIPSLEFKGVKTSREGWGMEKKFVGLS